MFFCIFAGSVYNVRISVCELLVEARTKLRVLRILKFVFGYPVRDLYELLPLELCDSMNLEVLFKIAFLRLVSKT